MNDQAENSSKSDSFEEITLANGCFWCTEAIFKRVRGIISVVPGYSGGFLTDPSYDHLVQAKLVTLKLSKSALIRKSSH